MTRLNRRVIQVRLGPLLYESRETPGGGAGHRIDFSASKTISKEPNTAEVSVYNPFADEALSFLRAKGVEQSVELYAGWEQGGIGLVAKGNPVKDGVRLNWESPERILTVKFADGLRTYVGGRVQFKVAAGARLSEVLRLAAESAGIGGTVVVPEDADRVLATSYKASGRFSDVVSDLARATGANWSIQDGALQVLGLDNVRPGEGPLFSPDLGNLVGAPEMKGRDGAVFTVLLSPDVRPGTRFKVEWPGPGVGSGVWKAVAVKHRGSNYGNEYYTQIEARPSP
jgi:hypothetical protein